MGIPIHPTRVTTGDPHPAFSMSLTTSRQAPSHILETPRQLWTQSPCAGRQLAPTRQANGNHIDSEPSKRYTGAAISSNNQK